jgi:hypothetical protein
VIRREIMMKRWTKRTFWTLVVLAMAAAVIGRGDSVRAADKKDEPHPCRQEPHQHGFWHSECKETPTEKGGAGGGTAAPEEKDFVGTILPAADALLKKNLSLGSACVDGVNATAEDRSCQHAVRSYTALMFNLASGRVTPECEISLATQACASTTVADAVDELAALIKSKEGRKCELAYECAKAINNGSAFRLQGL